MGRFQTFLSGIRQAAGLRAARSVAEGSLEAWEISLESLAARSIRRFAPQASCGPFAPAMHLELIRRQKGWEGRPVASARLLRGSPSRLDLHLDGIALCLDSDLVNQLRYLYFEASREVRRQHQRPVPNPYPSPRVLGLAELLRLRGGPKGGPGLEVSIKTMGLGLDLMTGLDSRCGLSRMRLCLARAVVSCIAWCSASHAGIRTGTGARCTWHWWRSPSRTSSGPPWIR